MAVALLAVGLSLCLAETLSAQSTDAPAEESRLETTAQFLGGAAIGLGLHEGSHVLFDVVLGTAPGIKHVSYAGIPFFAITHDPVSPPQEFTISSAGFWAQHVSSEILLSRRPRLRHERAPVAKGLLAFNVLTSVMYAGAALARTGPPERDTRGIAVSARIDERWVAPILLAPAVLDSLRYFKPESKVAKWASRAAKVGGVILIVRSRS